MSWIYYNSSDNEYRYALGTVQDNPSKLLFCIGINPSYAAPQNLDPTAKRIEKIAKEHGYDSWIILNICAQRATNPDSMDKIQNSVAHKENLKIIRELLNRYCNCSDILFAYGDIIGKNDYLQENLCEIINIIKLNQYNGNCYCLGKTKAGNPRHPLYQKVDMPFVLYSLDGHTYSEIVYLADNECVIREYSDNGELVLETLGYVAQND